MRAGVRGISPGQVIPLLSSPLLGHRGEHLHLAPLPNWGPPPPTVCKSLALESSSVPSTSPRLFWLPAWLEQRWGLVARTPLGAHHPFVAAICPCQSRDSRPQGPPITAQASQFRHRQPISASADRSGPPPPAPARRPRAQVHLQPPPASWTRGVPIPLLRLRLAALSLSLPLCKMGTGRLWVTGGTVQEGPPSTCLSGGPHRAGHVVGQGPRRAGWTWDPGDPSRPETSWASYLPDREVALSLRKLGTGDI